MRPHCPWITFFLHNNYIYSRSLKKKLLLLAEGIGVVMYLLAPKLVALFTPTQAVIDLGVRQARTISLFYCLLAPRGRGISYCLW